MIETVEPATPAPADVIRKLEAALSMLADGDNAMAASLVRAALAALRPK
ncbi:hypothetical protein [Variovorax paradoxus]|nr:hypothetical protein [Variovorax paradoxus]WGT64784.1 hypothetical protein QHG62_05435 [Variovorax paradoxus]